MDIPVLDRVLDDIILPRGVSIQRKERGSRLIRNESRRMYELTLLYKREQEVVAFGEYETYTKDGLVKADIEASKKRISEGTATTFDHDLVAKSGTGELPVSVTKTAVPVPAPAKLTAEEQKAADELKKKQAENRAAYKKTVADIFNVYPEDKAFLALYDYSGISEDKARNFDGSLVANPFSLDSFIARVQKAAFDLKLRVDIDRRESNA